MNYLITIFATAAITLTLSAWYYNNDRLTALKPGDWNLRLPPDNRTAITIDVSTFLGKRIKAECNNGQLTVSDPDYIPLQIITNPIKRILWKY